MAPTSQSKNSKSRALVYFYCGNNTTMRQEEEFQGLLHQECSVVKPIVASASEYEKETLFLNCQTKIFLRITMKEVGRPQSAAHMQVDNTTTCNMCMTIYNKSQRHSTYVYTIFMIE